MNPMLKVLNQSRGNGLLPLLASMKNGNPDAMFKQLMNSNGQFRQFVEQNKDKTPEQIANEYGVDYSLFQSLLK